MFHCPYVLLKLRSIYACGCKWYCSLQDSDHCDHVNVLYTTDNPCVEFLRLRLKKGKSETQTAMKVGYKHVQPKIFTEQISACFE